MFFKRKACSINAYIIASNMLVSISRSGLFTFFNGLIHSGYPQSKIIFILPVIESNVNRICFMAKRYVISGIFHSWSHVNTLGQKFFVVPHSRKLTALKQINRLR